MAICALFGRNGKAPTRPRGIRSTFGKLGFSFIDGVGALDHLRKCQQATTKQIMNMLLTGLFISMPNDPC